MTRNLLGNCVATSIVSKWDNALDQRQAREVLAAPEDSAKSLVAETSEATRNGDKSSTVETLSPVETARESSSKT